MKKKVKSNTKIILQENVKIMYDKVIEKISNEDFDNIFKDDLGLSAIYCEYKKDIVKIINENGQGYYYDIMSALWIEKDSTFFIKDVMVFLSDHIGRAIEKYNREVKSDESVKKLGELVKILKQVRKINNCKSVFEACKSQLMDIQFKSKLNVEPNLLPIKENKVIDLKTLKVRSRTMSDLFDYEIQCTFDKKMRLDNVEKFMLQLMNNNKEIVDYLQIQLGYSITAEIDQRCIYICWGVGSNGKSTLFDLLSKIMGKLYVPVSKKVFIREDTSSSHTEHLMPLIGARIAVYSESEKEEKLNESLIKTLTGGDMISARGLYQKQIKFKPIAKYFLLTNHKPIFNISDVAILDRITYFAFSSRFTDVPKNGEFKKDILFINKLMNEHLDEVFIWLCIGAYKYYQAKEINIKIKIPKEIEEAKQCYINELDSVKQFIESNGFRSHEIKNETNKLENYNRSELYNSFYEWFKANINNDNKIIKNVDFFKRLRDLGFAEVKNKGLYYFKIAKMNDADDDDDNSEDF